jgi:hypothetical protein
MAITVPESSRHQENARRTRCNPLGRNRNKHDGRRSVPAAANRNATGQHGDRDGQASIRRRNTRPTRFGRNRRNLVAAKNGKAQRKGPPVNCRGRWQVQLVGSGPAGSGDCRLAPERMQQKTRGSFRWNFIPANQHRFKLLAYLSPMIMTFTHLFFDQGNPLRHACGDRVKSAPVLILGGFGWHGTAARGHEEALAESAQFVCRTRLWPDSGMC